MKASIIAIALILAVSSKSYTQSYQEKYKADICQCIEAEKADVKHLESSFEKCFKKHITKYAVSIDAEIKEANSTQKYVKGQKARLELKQKFKYELVNSCNYYFNTLNNARQLVLKKLRALPVDSTELEKQNQNVALKPHWQNYFSRAQVYFKLGRLKKAEQDLLESLKINPYGKMPLYVRKEMLLLAWVLEEQNRFNEAIEIYNKISIGKIDSEVDILKTIVKRRQGNKYNSSKVTIKQTINKNKKLTPLKKTEATKNKASKPKDSIQSLKKLFKL